MIERCWVDVHPCTGLHDIDDDQTDDQCKAAYDFEVDQRVRTRLAHCFHALHAADASHDRAEDDGRNQHLYQLDKAIAQRLHRRA